MRIMGKGFCSSSVYFRNTDKEERIDMAEKLLEIRDLHAGVEGKEILKGLDLSINKGEVHVIL